MKRFWHLAAFSLLAAALAGCQGAANAPSKTADAAKVSDSAGHTHSHEATIADDVLAALPEEDRAPVKLQKICPVSGEPLGSMGAPVKVVTDGGSAYMCCVGCEDEFRRDPTQYLSKLPAPKSP